MTEDEIILAFIACLGIEPRQADLMVLQLMPGNIDPETVAAFIWDHWMGEPEEPTFEEVLAVVEAQVGKTMKPATERE